MTDIQTIIGVSIALLVLIVVPLIFLYNKGPWPFRTTIPNIVILIILFCLLYTPVHELSHVAGAYLSGIQVRDIQIFPKFFEGHIITARYHPLNVRHVWQFVIMTGFPYILDVIGSILGIFILRRNFSMNSFVAGFLFMFLCLRPAFDFIGETLGFLSRNGGDFHQIARCIGFSATWWILSFSIVLTLVSIFIVTNRFTGFPKFKSDGVVKSLD